MPRNQSACILRTRARRATRTGLTSAYVTAVSACHEPLVPGGGGGRELSSIPAAAALFGSGAYLASGLVVQSVGFAGKNLMMGTMAFIAAWPIWLFLAE